MVIEPKPLDRVIITTEPYRLQMGEFTKKERGQYLIILDSGLKTLRPRNEFGILKEDE